jgi:hypothetical protein
MGMFAASSCSMLYTCTVAKQRIIWSVWGAAVPFYARTRLQSQDEQHDVRTFTVYPGKSIREKADSPRPTLSALPSTRVSTAAHSLALKWRWSGTRADSLRLNECSCVGGADVLTRTRNKPSFTPRRSGGGTRVHSVSLWSCAHVRVPWIRAGGRKTEETLLQTLAVAVQYSVSLGTAVHTRA